MNSLTVAVKGWTLKGWGTAIRILKQTSGSGLVIICQKGF